MPLPRKIHYCWFGNGEKSELVEKCIASWKKYCPDCEIIEWNETNYDVTKNEYMHQAYQAKRWGFVSDYARLDIVYEHGGIYLDTDVEIIKDFSPLFAGNGFLGFEKNELNKNSYLVNTGQGFGATEQNEVIKEMLDIYNDLAFQNDDGSNNLTTCPLYNTKALNSLGLKNDNTLQCIKGITIYPSEYFCPLNWESKKLEITENTYSIHHFNASWLSDAEKKKRKRERKIDYIKHIPNRVLMKLLGKDRYEKLKHNLK